MKYRISVCGCDDRTVFELELSEHDAAVVQRVAEACTEASSYLCMPTMTVTLVEQPNASLSGGSAAKENSDG